MAHPNRAVDLAVDLANHNLDFDPKMETNGNVNEVARHAEAPKDLEKRASRNRVESLGQVDKQRVRFKAVLLTFS